MARMSGILTPSTMVEDSTPGWLGFVGDGMLPSYMGFLIDHYNDPY